MKLKPYPSYKDSGVHWLGQIPEEWSTWKISHAFGSVGSGTTPPSNEQEWYENGNIPWITTGELRENIIFETVKFVTPSAFNKFSTLRLHPAGSLAIAMYGATIGRLGILGVDATTNQACCVLGHPKYLDIKFTFYWFLGFKQKIVDLYATGGGQPNINQETIVSLRIPAPCLDDQTDIAAFLDHETGKLDTLIAKQEQLIELLQEKRQGIISHAVTKGLNPDAKMKDSGVEWLGVVPDEWVSWKISHAFGAFGSGTTPPSSEQEWYLDGDVPWVTTGELRENVIYETIKSVTSAACSKFSSLRLHPAGSLAIAMYGATIGRLGILGVDATTNQACCVLSYPKHLNIKFMFYWFLGFKQIIIDLYASGGGQPNINQEIITGLRVFAPRLDEQLRISNYLDEQTMAIDDLIEKANQSIKLAKEHRTALISAAVTGKIDVREAA